MEVNDFEILLLFMIMFYFKNVVFNVLIKK